VEREGVLSARATPPPSELCSPRARRAAPRHPLLVLRRPWARRAIRLGHALSAGGVGRLNL
jgi:hypothetical protein